jgi:exonuclease III
LSTLFVSLFTFIFWNADGFTLEKQAEFDNLLHKREVDAFAVCEAGSVSDNGKFGDLDVQGYVIYYLPRERQVAAGMIIGVKIGLTARFEILHAMEEDDKMELVQLEIWRGHTKTKYIIAYNPPNNITDKLETLEIDKSIILIGDYNAHNTRWGYRDTCRLGKSLKEYIDSQPLLILDGTPNPKYIPIKHS